LELGCGTGRVTIPLAQAGVAVTGVEVAPAMLAAAKRKVAALPEEVRARVELVRGDMRSFSLPKKFALAIAPYRAFMHLLTVEDQRAALEAVRTHLQDGGLFVFDVAEPTPEALVESAGVGAPLRLGSEFIVPGRWTRVVITRGVRTDRARQILQETLI